MEKKARLIEVRTIEGKPIFSFYVTDKEVAPDKNSSSGQKQETKGEKNQNNHQQNNDSLMSDAQKRYLFRILADQGKEGDDALEHLKNLFQVELLKDVTKSEASRMIERLLEGAKGGDGNGIPF